MIGMLEAAWPGRPRATPETAETPSEPRIFSDHTPGRDRTAGRGLPGPRDIARVLQARLNSECIELEPLPEPQTAGPDASPVRHAKRTSGPFTSVHDEFQASRVRFTRLLSPCTPSAAATGRNAGYRSATARRGDRSSTQTGFASEILLAIRLRGRIVAIRDYFGWFWPAPQLPRWHFSHRGTNLQQHSADPHDAEHRHRGPLERPRRSALRSR